jgi:Protein of unknown function (DUF3152)
VPARARCRGPLVAAFALAAAGVLLAPVAAPAAAGTTSAAVRAAMPIAGVPGLDRPGIPAIFRPPEPVRSAPVGAVAGPAAPVLSTADRAAGLTGRLLGSSASGEFVVAAGSSPAPQAQTVHAVRVEVERGLPADPDRFAAFVLATLNDPRGWGHGGGLSFARTDGPADLIVMLASPDTTERLCRPLDTGGTLSCRHGDRAVVTIHRWINCTPDYAADPTAYRQYVVNHEVGHWLGHGHVRCPGPGRPAPVMQQQTLGMQGCLPDPWPHPAP